MLLTDLQQRMIAVLLKQSIAEGLLAFSCYFYSYLYPIRKRPASQQINLLSDDEQSNHHDKDIHHRKKASLEVGKEATSTPSKTRKLPSSMTVTSPSPNKKRVFCLGVALCCVTFPFFLVLENQRWSVRG
jgi:tRNA(Leu) C34 or U34 (ribose-2'-O)-methylase TrmL